MIYLAGRMFAAAVLVVLGGCVGVSGGGEPVWIVHLTQDEVRATKEIVSAHLIDPRSAIWSDMVGVRDEAGHGVTVCGMVDSKAVNGGYPGMRPYKVYLEPTGVQLVSLAPAIRLWDHRAQRNCLPFKRG
jgi:hypothetical protein